MQRLIVTGANGSGKSHLAAHLATFRADVPVVSFDAIKLKRNWEQRSRAEVEIRLASVVAEKAWILEGGPSLLSHALERADGVIWLDPPEYIRAWRLAIRPLRNFGRTRPELPPGNADWPLEQYRFAMRSLRRGDQLRDFISSSLKEVSGLAVWRCRNQKQIDAAVSFCHE